MFDQVSLLCTLPKDLFTSQVLVELKLCGGFVCDVAGPVSLPSLKTIQMSGCKFSNGNSVKRLLSSCPVLENLSLWRCGSCDGNVISISVLSLKHLSIYDLWSGCEWELNNVPNLETLDLYIRNRSTTKCCSVNILKSLRKASIDVYDDEAYDMNMIWKLVNKFEEVRSLSLSGDWMESLARDSFLLRTFSKLTKLALKVNFSHGWKFFPILLETSSSLEQLEIKVDGFSNCNQEFLEIDILLPKRIPMCFSRSLKEVELRMFKEKKVKYEWLGYLLKNAEVLEMLVIVVLVDDGEEDFAYSEKVRKNLLALPRDSENCRIVVVERVV